MFWRTDMFSDEWNERWVSQPINIMRLESESVTVKAKYIGYYTSILAITYKAKLLFPLEKEIATHSSILA